MPLVFVCVNFRVQQNGIFENMEFAVWREYIRNGMPGRTRLGTLWVRRNESEPQAVQVTYSIIEHSSDEEFDRINEFGYREWSRMLNMKATRD